MPDLTAARAAPLPGVRPDVPPDVPPDTKDWTWVLQEPCPACGFDASSVATADLAAEVRRYAAGWPVLLAAPDAAVRPDPAVWSVLEYACHVRDVHRVFAERVALVLGQDDPVFANWDQDETALAERYAEQDPRVVAGELVAAAERVAAAYDAVPEDAWDRPGRRSNGSVFTLASLGRYHLHDVVHHDHDVRAAAARATVAAYAAAAQDWRATVLAREDLLGPARERFVAALPRGARVLEVGSAAGRDAAALEAAGVSVRRTDVTAAFVDLLRGDGHAADVLDPLTDDLDDPERPGTPYDGVWASASLLHVARGDLPTVLARLAAATRADGVLHLSLKEGRGEGWSTHGSVGAPRRFTYWLEDDLREVLARSGWSVRGLRRLDGNRGERWLEVLAAVVP